MPLALVLVLACSASGGPDSDGDGLSDFHEVHKHRTDPRSPDSDGDGKGDGEWGERREFTYVVRTVVQVLRPVTPEYLTDDFQDARVLDATDGYVELEVLHYPFSTAGEALGADGNGERRRGAAGPELARWLAPGPTADWDEELRRRLHAALVADGIDVRALDDRELVERVATWLLERAEHVDRFATFCTAFDEDGSPFLPEELRPHLGDGAEAPEEAWEREISARGMFENRERGSCTSTAIYLTGCLRALGIPTRIVLCIPLFDAGDEREWALVREGIRLTPVRREVLGAMEGLRGSWASHTFNEVWLEGRWWRLDYAELGVGILRAERFGLLTHVATFGDWADARMHETVGRRQTLGSRSAVLDGTNPYSTISVRDEVGEHCTLALPSDVLTASVDSLVWTDEPSLPEDVRKSYERSGRFGLLARVTGPGNGGELRELLALADLHVDLEAAGRPPVGTNLDPGCWWFRGDHALVHLPLAESALASGVEYGVRIRNGSPEARIEADPDLVVVRRP